LPQIREFWQLPILLDETLGHRYEVDWKPTLECGDIFGSDGHQPLTGFAGGPGDMRGEGEIFRSKERISGQDGLRRGNIAGSTCDTVGVMRKSVDFIFARESAEIIP